MRVDEIGWRMDLKKLITEVEARPAIWDQTNTQYHNRDVIVKLWAEIAKACDVSSSVAKSKWKHLRDNFRSELKKTYRNKQCSDGGSPSSNHDHESKWVWFKNLHFLRDQMRSVNGNNLHHQTYVEEVQVEPQIDIVEGDLKGHYDEDVDADGDSCQSMLSNNVQNHLKRKRTIQMDPLEIPNKQFIYDQRKYRDDYENDNDDTYHFLMSLRSSLRSLPLERQMDVRLRIHQMLLNEITHHKKQLHQCGLSDNQTTNDTDYLIMNN